MEPKKKTKEQKNSKAKKRLVLLDAHAIIHRAYHALPDFVSATGEPTGALYGLAAMLIKIIGDLKPDYIAACFDLATPTHRHHAFEGYKAKRKETEEDLARQIERSRDVLAAFDIPLYEQEGFEADDLLGTIVEQTKKDNDLETIIASGDMDTLQLVDGDRVIVFTLKKGINDTALYTEAAVNERYGFGPTLLPDYKGLAGDPSDNIPGVAGIGTKTATDLIQKFGTIEEIYQTLKKNQNTLLDAGIKKRTIELLKQNEEEALFSKMLATIRRDAPIDFSLPDKAWKETISPQKADEMFQRLSFRTLGPRLREVLNQKFDLALPLESASPVVPSDVSDEELQKAKIALWLIDSNTTNPEVHDITAWAKTENLTEAVKKLYIEIEKRQLSKVFNDIEVPLIPVIEKMQRRGILIDKKVFARLKIECQKEADTLQKKIWELAGEEFNISSPKQMAVLLFEKLALKVKGQKKTAGGALSTRESELEKMRDIHPIIGEILKYREVQKLLTTYIEPIPDMVEEDGRLHARFQQTGTTTGRMSSSNPNLQNLPVRSDTGRQIRCGVIAAPGFSLVSFDYSQIELRVAAFLSQDKKMIDVFRSGGDIHRAAAAEIFGTTPENVDAEMRRIAKIVNFGILYGMGISALDKLIGKGRAEARGFYQRYFEQFPGLAHYMEETKLFADKNGFTKTYFGRRRYFEGIRSHIPYIRAAAERMAINAPIQGTQSDIIKLAMGHANNLIESEKLDNDVFLLMQVHDELVYEIRDDKIVHVVPKIKEIMETMLSEKETAGIRFAAEASTGQNWGEMKRYNS